MGLSNGRNDEMGHAGAGTIPICSGDHAFGRDVARCQGPMGGWYNPKGWGPRLNQAWPERANWWRNWRTRWIYMRVSSGREAGERSIRLGPQL